MGCGGSRDATSNMEDDPDLAGLTGEALATAMRSHNAKTKWKSHKAPIDMDLLKELGLAGDDDGENEGGGSAEEKPDSAKTAASTKTKKSTNSEGVEKAENG